MRWYQVIITLVPEQKNLTFPAGSDINKAIDIGKHYLLEHGNLDSCFTILTIPDNQIQQGECVYVSAKDKHYQNSYRLEKCEQALGLQEKPSLCVELPAFLKQQAC